MLMPSLRFIIDNTLTMLFSLKTVTQSFPVIRFIAQDWNSSTLRARAGQI